MALKSSLKWNDQIPWHKLLKLNQEETGNINSSIFSKEIEFEI